MSATDVIGSTVKPRAEIRKGYSLVPCADPRYLTTRRRRVEISALTRWSSTITQSVTYSSIPCLVRLPPLPRSPVRTTVTSRSSSQRISRLSSDRTIVSSPNAPNSTSMVSSTTRLAPTRLIASSRIAKIGSKSNSPAATISDGSTRNASTASRPPR